MRKLIALCLVAAVQAQPVLASTWCPLIESAKAWNIPLSARVELSSSDKIAIDLGDNHAAECLPGTDGWFRCSQSLGLCSDQASSCDLDVGLFGLTETKFATSIREVDLAHVDLAKVQLWVQPEYDVQHMIFTVCTGGSTGTM